MAGLLLGLVLLIPSAARAESSGEAVAYQLDPAHDGYQTGDPIIAPLSRAWSVTLSGPISYPLIAGGVVYVTAASSGGGTTLYALRRATGSVLWSRGLGGTYSWSGLAYDAGRVFTVTSGGLLSAFNASSGASDWSTSLPGQTSFSSPPTAANGYVYTSGAGSAGTVYAADETTGKIVWTQSVANGDNSSPAVDANGVYVTYACNQDYDFNPLSGSLVWHYSGPCEGGGGKTPVLAGGFLFGRDADEGNLLLSASTGTTQGSFSATPAPAVGGGVAYMVSGGTLTAVDDWGAGTNAWTFNGDGRLDTAPLVVGNLVFAGSSAGHLYAVDPATGKSVWSTTLPAAVPAPDEQNVSQPLTGLGAGEGTLIVPTGSTLTAFISSNPNSHPSPSPKLPAPSNLHARRNGRKLNLRWSRVVGARAYDLTIAVCGNRRGYTLAGSAIRLTRRVARRGRVSVRLWAVAANGQPGSVAAVAIGRARACA